MSKQTVCDNDLCTTTYESLDDEQAIWWITVGWADLDARDACSVPCAMAVLDAMQQERWSIEQEADVETADVG